MRLLALLLVAAAALAQNPDGRVAGVVVDAATGEPLASVDFLFTRLLDADEADQIALTERGRTGLDGRFAFAGLVPGRYSISLMKDGYEAGARVGRAFELEASGERRTLQIDLRRSNAISGQVFDPDGDPVPEAAVHLLEWSTSHGDRGLRQMRTVRADDRGVYYIDGLGPGRYLIGAQPPQLPAPRGVLAFEMTPAFHPSGARPEDAAEVRLDWGGEVEGVDLALGWADATSIEGAAFDETGGGCRFCTVVVMALPGGYVLGNARAAEDGVFAIRGVPPGSYRLLAASRGRGGPNAAVAEVRAVAGRTVPAALELGLHVPVAGVVTFDEPPDTAPESGMQILLDSSLGGRIGARSQATVDWAAGGLVLFEEVAPGRYHVRPSGPPAGYYVDRILRYGRELPNAELTVADAAAVEGLEVRLASGAAAVTGQVQLEENRTAAPGVIALVPDDYGENGRYEIIASYRPDGGFEMTAVRPGRYTLFAAPVHNRIDLGRPGDLDWVRKNGERIEIKTGETLQTEAPLLVGP